MTRGQIDMFAEDVMDEAAFAVLRSEGHFDMLTDFYIEVKNHNLKKGWVANFQLHCEVKSVFILLLVEPEETVLAARRKINFILADEVAMKLLNCDSGLRRILFSSLLPLKAVSEEMFTKALFAVSGEAYFKADTDDLRNFLSSFLDVKGA